jgi:hypothetical protein
MALDLPTLLDMFDRLECNTDYLALRTAGKATLAGSIREREVTNRSTTHVINKSRKAQFAVRRWWIATTLAALLAACGGGGGKQTDTYARANNVQGDCCQHLQGGARDQCLAGIVRVDDAAVAKTETNQATYACVVQHFQCNPETGHPTQQSAQAQLECIQDLQ